MSADDVSAALRALLAQADRVPAAALAAANAALGWRDLDAELARLTGESALAVAHLRGGPPRLLAFRGPRVLVELEVAGAGETIRLLGQLDPPEAAEITVEWAAGRRRGRADERGRFSLDGLPAGWLRVAVAPVPVPGAAPAAPTRTEWFRA
jgi:hypothetical protein